MAERTLRSIRSASRQALARVAKRFSAAPAGDAAGPPPSRLAFVHVPKCGGTSVDAALRSALGISTLDGWIDPSISRLEAGAAVGGGVPEIAVPRWLDHRAYLLWHYLSERRPMVSGHGPVAGHVLDRFATETPFLTVLRDPVDRWISYYRFSRRTSDDPNVVPNRRSTVDPSDELEQVLASASGRYIGSFFATFLGGYRPYTDADPHDAVEAALDNLRRFAVVGFTSDWGDFVASCDRVLGVSVEIPRLNTTAEYEAPAGVGSDDLFTPEVRGRIEALCAADIDIYREARRLHGPAGRGGPLPSEAGPGAAPAVVSASRTT